MDQEPTHDNIAENDAHHRNPQELNRLDFAQIQRLLHRKRQQNKQECRTIPRSVQAFFIGPRGDNIDFFKGLMDSGIFSHVMARKSYGMDDNRHITRQMKRQPSFMKAQDSMEKSFNYLLTKLRNISPSFDNARQFGHMNWQTSIPALIGYFSTMLYNPNNCAYESSALTTQLQIDCMKEFAIMFEFPPMLDQGGTGENHELARSWGHFTCGGTLSNCEAFWSARSIKFLAFGLRQYIQSLPEQLFAKASQIQVHLITGQIKKLLQLSVWELINIDNDETMKLNDRVFQHVFDNDNSKYSEFNSGISSFTVGMEGLTDICYMMEDLNEKFPDPNWPKNKVPQPLSFYSATGHYSMPKSVSLLGIGESGIKKIEVDLDARMDTVQLENELNICVDKHIPILVVVGIAGSTDESAMDNLKEILAIKQRIAKKGLYFHFHIDGTYGSYFVSMIRQLQQGQLVSLSDYVKGQLQVFHKADSITFDPHKSGYVPYSCSGIFYRNYQLRNNLTFSAPYIFTGFEPNVSIYGVQGSKPGAAVSSVYLSIEVMPLERSGHGCILQRTMINTKILAADLYGMKNTLFSLTLDNAHKYQEYFNCCILSRDYVHKFNCPEATQIQEAAYKKISKVSLSQIPYLANDPLIGKYYYEIGPDLNIICYSLNFIDKGTGKWNTSLKKFNEFNKTISKLNKSFGNDLHIIDFQIDFKYGDAIFNDFLTRYGLSKDDSYIKLNRLKIMNPYFIEQNYESPHSLFTDQLAKNACEALDYLIQNNWKKDK